MVGRKRRTATKGIDKKYIATWPEIRDRIDAIDARTGGKFKPFLANSMKQYIINNLPEGHILRKMYGIDGKS